MLFSLSLFRLDDGSNKYTEYADFQDAWRAFTSVASLFMTGDYPHSRMRLVRHHADNPGLTDLVALFTNQPEGL